MTTALQAPQIDWRPQTRATGDGHLVWTGTYHNSAGSVHIGNTRYSVPLLVYVEHRRREPNGKLTTSCRVHGCIEPEHLWDFDERQEHYRDIAIALGRATYDGRCSQGHPWTDARFSWNGKRACWPCRRGEPPVIDDSAVELALAGCPEDLARVDALEVVRRAICTRGLTHKQAAALIGRTPRTITRWATRHGWVKPPAARWP